MSDGPIIRAIFLAAAIVTIATPFMPYLQNHWLWTAVAVAICAAYLSSLAPGLIAAVRRCADNGLSTLFPPRKCPTCGRIVGPNALLEYFNVPSMPAPSWILVSPDTKFTKRQIDYLAGKRPAAPTTIPASCG